MMIFAKKNKICYIYDIVTYQLSMNTIEQFLNSLWLENLESQVYITALAFWTVPASILANKLSIPRSTARYTCEQLVRKKLMTEAKKWNAKLFTPENPTKLASILYEQELELKRKRNDLTNITQQLQKIYNPYTNIPDVTFYEGDEGVQKMLDIFSDLPGEVRTLSAGDYISERNPELVKRFRQRAMQINRDIYVIRAAKYKKVHESKNEKHYKTRYFRHLDELKIDIQIREGTIWLVSILDNAPIGIMIKHQEIADEFQKLFQELWSWANE